MPILPENWRAEPLRRLVRSLESGTSVNSYDWPATDGEVAVLRTSCVYSGRFSAWENKVVISDEVERVTCPVRQGSLIVSRMNTPDLVGAAGLVTAPAPGIFLPDRLWQVTVQDVDATFVYWWTQSASYRAQVEAACTGTSASMKNLAQDQFYSFIVPVPSQEEQHAIATFLDRETAKIDALVAEHERLIELMREKRRAVIHRVITKGLVAEVQLTPSTADWIGSIPAHWRLKRLKHLSPSLTVGIVVNPSSYVSDSGLPFIYGGDITEGAIDWANSRRISPEASQEQAKTVLRSGDLLTVRVGTPGVTAVVPIECEGGNCASVMLVRGGPFNSDWLCYAMNSRLLRYQVEVVQYGAAQEQFNISHAVDFWVPTPPRAEQDLMVSYLNAVTGKIDGLLSDAEALIGVLRERRAALISAAVTGQIDVRGLVAA